MFVKIAGEECDTARGLIEAGNTAVDQATTNLPLINLPPWLSLAAFLCGRFMHSHAAGSRLYTTP